MLTNLIGLPKKNEVGTSNDLFPKFESVDNFIGLTLMVKSKHISFFILMISYRMQTLYSTPVFTMVTAKIGTNGKLTISHFLSIKTVQMNVWNALNNKIMKFNKWKIKFLSNFLKWIWILYFHLKGGLIELMLRWFLILLAWKSQFRQIFHYRLLKLQWLK